MENTKIIQEIRRERLNIFIKKNFNTLAEFGKKAGMNKTNISSLLNGLRPFTDRTADKIEKTFALPDGYLSNKDEQHYALTEFVSIKFYEDINSTLDPLSAKKITVASQICNKLGAHNPEDLIAVEMNDELMYPTINKDELIIVDTSQQKIEENKIYLFEMDGFFKVRRLVTAGKQFAALHIDNDNERKRYITSNIPLSEIHVIGRVVGGIKNYN